MLSGKSVNHNILFVCLETQRIFTVQLMFVTQLYDYDEKNSWLCLAVLKCVRFLYNCLDKNRFGLWMIYGNRRIQLRRVLPKCPNCSHMSESK